MGIFRRKKKKQRTNKRKPTEKSIKRVKRAFSRTLMVLALVIAVPALSFGVWKLYGVVQKSPYLEIVTVNVKGAERVESGELVSISGVESGQNILSVDKKSTIRMLEAHPWVMEARIGRQAPDTINIEITERVPRSFVSLDAIYVMDENGKIFKRYSPGDNLDLPIITGLDKVALKEKGFVVDPEVMALLGYLEGRDGLSLDGLSEIHIDPVHGHSIYTFAGLRLDLGRGSLSDIVSARLALYEKIVSARGGVVRDVVSMDLDNERGVVVKLKDRDGKGGGKGYGKKG